MSDAWIYLMCGIAAYFSSKIVSERISFRRGFLRHDTKTIQFCVQCTSWHRRRMTQQPKDTNKRRRRNPLEGSFLLSGLLRFQHRACKTCEVTN
ncbi:uncharacterized protein BJX67DRAFT_363425 [Aspergillus lucknowensis]|uniref:Secreted protein n=1 Tax=Aspergillus lucknowensis TaxID=176173 RepID=A0ABR4LGF4_9EURO